MRFTLKAPNDYGPVEDLAFTMFAVSTEKVREALDHLINNPDDLEILQTKFGLSTEEFNQVLKEWF